MSFAVDMIDTDYNLNNIRAIVLKHIKMSLIESQWALSKQILIAIILGGKWTIVPFYTRTMFAVNTEEKSL